MAEYASTESGNREKIKTPFAKIIVNYDAGDAYYNVMWWQDGEMQIGFGSRDLKFVRKWLSDEFEMDTTEADVAPVVRCRDCKYGDYDSKPDGAMVCLRTKDGFWRKETDFCSYGERKDNDEREL